MADTSWAAALFPQHTKHSGAAAVMKAADQATAEHQRLVEWHQKVAAALEIPSTAPADSAAAIARETLRRARQSEHPGEVR